MSASEPERPPSEARDVDTGCAQLRCRIESGVATITLDRPEARNALTIDMKHALWQLLPALVRDERARVVLLTGAGPAFCAGGDTKRMKHEGKPASMEDRRRQLRWEHDLPRMLHTMAMPTIAALPGAAAGAGLGLALACDLRIAAHSVLMTTSYARLGLSGDYGVSWFLTQLVGTARARELFFTSARIDGAECLRLGLVNRLVADDALEAEATALARQIAAGPPVALAYMKETLGLACHADLDQVLEAEADRMVRGAQTSDYVEAVAAFADKRPPRFRGR